MKTIFSPNASSISGLGKSGVIFVLEQSDQLQIAQAGQESDFMPDSDGTVEALRTPSSFGSERLI